MKKRVIFLLTGLFIWTSVLLAQNVPEGVIGAFKEGNSQELNKYLGEKVFGFSFVTQNGDPRF